MQQDKSCPICSALDVEIRLSEVRDYITGESFAILFCQQCKVGFTYPAPVSLEQYYPRKYRRYAASVMSLLRALYRLRVARWARMFERPGTVLEVGCGDGTMLRCFRELGWEVMGYERTEEMTQAARGNGIVVRTGNFAEASTPGSLDLIILFQTLEHLSEPQVILQTCFELLQPGGRLIICVSNMDSWQARYARRYWFHLDPPRHLFHFSEASLKLLLEKSRFQVDRVSYASWEHDPYGWVQSTLNRHFGNQNRITKILMKLEKPKLADALTLLFSPVLLAVSFGLAWVSWGFKRGALLEVVAVKPNS